MLVALALGLLTSSCGRTPDGQTRRPNVLWIVTDQHRADIAGYEGNAFAATPSLDRLATEAVRVSDFYCQVPLCVPARQSLLTGQFAHSHGAFRNTASFPAEQRTIAHAFAEAAKCVGEFLFPAAVLIKHIRILLLFELETSPFERLYRRQANTGMFSIRVDRLRPTGSACLRRAPDLGRGSGARSRIGRRNCLGWCRR